MHGSWHTDSVSCNLWSGRAHEEEVRQRCEVCPHACRETLAARHTACRPAGDGRQPPRYSRRTRCMRSGWGRTGLDVEFGEVLLQGDAGGEAGGGAKDDGRHEHAGGNADASAEREHGEVHGGVEEQSSLRETGGVDGDLPGGLGGVAMADGEQAADELVRGRPEAGRKVVVLAGVARPLHGLHVPRRSVQHRC